VKVREDIDDDDSSGSEIGGDRDEDDAQASQAKMKSRMNDDWNYLKQTIAGGFGGGAKPQDEHPEIDKENRPSQEMLDFQDKADTLMEKEEEMIQAHMNLIKDNAHLLTKEGELISYVQGKPIQVLKFLVENDDYEIEEYVEKMESII